MLIQSSIACYGFKNFARSKNFQVVKTDRKEELNQRNWWLQLRLDQFMVIPCDLLCTVSIFSIRSIHLIGYSFWRGRQVRWSIFEPCQICEWMVANHDVFIQREDKKQKNEVGGHNFGNLIVVTDGFHFAVHRRKKHQRVVMIDDVCGRIVSDVLRGCKGLQSIRSISSIWSELIIWTFPKGPVLIY